MASTLSPAEQGGRWKFSGFHFPTTTPIPDQLFDELLPILSGSEIKVLLYICRRTFGFKKSSDTISLSQMIDGITTRDGKVLDGGTGLSKATIARCLNSLEEKNVIVRARNRSDERGDQPTTYALNIVPPLSQNETPPVSLVRHPLSQQRDAPVSQQRDTQETVLQQTDRQQTDRQQQASNQTTNLASSANATVVVALTDLGIASRVARRLSSHYSEEYILEKIAYFQFLQANAPKKLTNPRGWLRRAIEEDYGPPDGYLSPRTQVEKEKQARQQEEEQLRQTTEDSRHRREIQQRRKLARIEYLQGLNEKYGTTADELELWGELIRNLEAEAPQIAASVLHDAQLLRVKDGVALIGVNNERSQSQLESHPGTNRVVGETLERMLGESTTLVFIRLE